MQLFSAERGDLQPLRCCSHFNLLEGYSLRCACMYVHSRGRQPTLLVDELTIRNISFGFVEIH